MKLEAPPRFRTRATSLRDIWRSAGPLTNRQTSIGFSKRIIAGTYKAVDLTAALIWNPRVDPCRGARQRIFAQPIIEQLEKDHPEIPLRALLTQEGLLPAADDPTTQLLPLAKKAIASDWYLKDICSTFPQAKHNLANLMTRFLSNFSPEQREQAERGPRDDRFWFMGEIARALTTRAEPQFLAAAYLYKLDDLTRTILNKTGGDRSSIEPILYRECFELAAVLGAKGAIRMLDRLTKQWDDMGNSGLASTQVLFHFAIKMFHENLYDCNVGHCYGQPLGPVEPTIDALFARPQWLGLVELLSKESLSFHGRRYKVERAALLSDDVKAGEISGKNNIFKISAPEEQGAGKTFLAKWAKARDVRHDRIGTSVSRLLGSPSYRVALPHERAESSASAWELIEYEPHDVVAYEWQDALNAPMMIYGNVRPSLEGLRSLGTVFAIEHLLGAGDAGMKHDLLARENGLFFKIDWENLFDFTNQQHGNAFPVLRGDERRYLKEGLTPPAVEVVKQGFIAGLLRARSKWEPILSTVRQNLNGVAEIAEISEITANIGARLMDDPGALFDRLLH